MSLTLDFIDGLPGEEFEQLLKPVLEAQGFTNIKVTQRTRDFGVDLKGTKNNLTYAVQAKRYGKKVGLKAVQEAFSGMAYLDADHSMVIANQEFTEAAVEFAERVNCKLVGRRELGLWLKTRIRTVHKKIKPRPAQRLALNALEQLRKKGQNKALVIMATGLGKTYLVALDAHRFLKKKGKILFIVHQTDILEQAEKAFFDVFGTDYSTGFYHGFKKDKDADILFATFQTLSKKLRKFKPNEFDYVIVDETHHAHARTYKPVVDYFKPKFRVGITATPDRRDSLEVAEFYDYNIAFDLGLEKALVRGYLCPVKYRLFTDNVNYKGITDGIFNYTVKDLNKKLFIPKRDDEIAKEYYAAIKSVKDPKTIIFCPSIGYAEMIHKYFADSIVLHSRVKRARRAEIIDDFKAGKYKAILTIDMFNEGVDVPDANVIVFLRSTQSHTIFIQQLGRGLRKLERKKHVLVLDFVANCERVKMLWGFKSRINEEFKKVSRYKTNKGMYFHIADVDFDKKARDILEVLKKIEESRAKPWHYWDNFENLKKELLPICEELNKFPTQAYLHSIKRDDISNAISKHGGTPKVAKEVGYPTDFTPVGYWDKIETLKAELLPICKDLGSFPSGTYLRSIGRRDLEHAIIYHGKPNIVASKLGYPLSTKTKGYWKDFKNLKKEVLPICKKLHEFPTFDYLRSIDKAELISVINRHGGVSKVAKKLGYPTAQKSKGYWNDFTNVRAELLPICKQLGYLPSENYLRGVGRSCLGNAIGLHGGAQKVARRLGYPTASEPKKSKFPTLSYLTSIGRGELLHPITRHGGVHEVAKRLGYEVDGAEYGYWKDFKNVKKELLPICKKLGKFPTLAYLRRIGKGGLAKAIPQHGGVHEVARRLGYEVDYAEYGYWKDFDNVREELLPICKKLGKFPTMEYLNKTGKNGLRRAIQKYGGIHEVAKRLGYETEETEYGYWTDSKSVEKELLPICKKLGKFPTYDYLRSNGKGGLASAISKHGGTYKFAKRLGYEVGETEHGYWTDFDNVKKELLPICKELHRFPTLTYLHSIGKGGLAKAISKHGRVEKVAKRLGYPLSGDPHSMRVK